MNICLSLTREMVQSPGNHNQRALSPSQIAISEVGPVTSSWYSRGEKHPHTIHGERAACCPDCPSNFFILIFTIFV